MLCRPKIPIFSKQQSAQACPALHFSNGRVRVRSRQLRVFCAQQSNPQTKLENKVSNTENPPKEHQITGLEDKPRGPASKYALIFLAVGQFALLWYSAFYMLGADGPATALRAFVISAIAAIVAYTVNHGSIEHGARLAALNFKGVRTTCIAAIIVVGGAIASATIGGGVKTLVGDIRLQEHGVKIEAVINRRNELSVEAAQTLPILSTIRNDLEQYATCERLSGCIHQDGIPGVGRVTRLLTEKSERATNIAQIISDGEINRQESLAQLGDLVAEYQEILHNEALSFADRRAALQAHYSEIVQESAILDNAIPLPALFAYADELQEPVSVAGQPQTGRTVSSILSGHGKSLERVLDEIGVNEASFPPFPNATSLADTMAYIAYYWPFAAAIYAAEIGLPLFLFIVSYSRLYWIIVQNFGQRKRADNTDSEFDFGPYLPLLGKRASALNGANNPTDGNSKPNGRVN